MIAHQNLNIFLTTIMKPTNEKTLLSHIFEQMYLLEKGEISENTAIAQSKLITNATRMFQMELDRARLLKDLSDHNRATGESIKIRNLTSSK